MSPDEQEEPRKPPPMADPPKESKEPSKRRAGLFGSRVLTVGTVRGIRFDLDPTWFVVFFYVTYMVGNAFQEDHDTWSGLTVWLSAIAGSSIFFLSIILHELGHSVVAIALGLKVRSITLFLFGGVAELSGEPKRPRDEFLIAVAGPAVSFLLAMGFFILYITSTTGQPVKVVSAWLGMVNLGVAMFNMLPGFPLDGGRVFRSILWRILEDFERATQWAGKLGILLGNALTALGFVVVILGNRPLAGLFLAFVGWFLSRSARATTVQALLTSRLRSLRVRDAAKIDHPPVDSWDTLEEVVQSVPDIKVGGVLVLEGEDLVGALGPEELAKSSPSKYAFHAARKFMTPLADLVRVGPGETLFAALQLMEREEVSQLLVEDAGTPLGLLSRDGLTRAVKLG